jgi:hypothetical protein
MVALEHEEIADGHGGLRSVAGGQARDQLQELPARGLHLMDQVVD